jgi:iron complex outermembrane receptor protein
LLEKSQFVHIKNDPEVYPDGRMRKSAVPIMLMAGLLACCATALRAADLADLPIEALLQMEVTTVSRKSEKLAETPAAVTVVTHDDIERSGAMSFPQALRLVPGLQVAQVDAGQWALSARGFNDVFANKLLVLQDGRSIYTPLFSGVFWDIQGTMMEDIDRIEVIRGPGATLWGANAVNGVINIITRSAKETQGTLLTLGGGTEERAFAGVRYGGQISDNAYFRVYGMYGNHDDSLLPTGKDAHDAWQQGKWGFRVDWDISDQNQLTLQGDAATGEFDQVIGVFDPAATNFTRLARGDDRVEGGNVLGRWTHTFSANSDLRVQAYYDRTERNTVIFDEKRDTFDVDFQHRFGIGDRNDIVWGAGYRVTSDAVGNSPTISVNPDNRTDNLFSAFVQDEITLVPEKLGLMIGSKIEHNDYTGIEVQPSGRMHWTPFENHAFWASISGAVRSPSRVEDDVALNQVIPPGGLFPGSPAAVTTTYGNRDFVSEELLAYEVGYRVQARKNLSMDFALFYNEYDHLRSFEPGPSPTQPAMPGTIPLHVANDLFGETYGAEAALTFQATPWWRLQPGYSVIEMQLHKRAASQDPFSEQDEGKTPEQQWSLRSSMDLPHDISLDCMLRYVDSLPALKVESYWGLDIRVAWRPTHWLELSIVGQNLVESRHAEFSPTFIATQRTEVQRGCYGKVTLRF